MGTRQCVCFRSSHCFLLKITDLRINNQQDASSTKYFFYQGTLHVSGVFCAHHQELSAVHVAIGMFHVLIL
jgi:hypothetical protein